MSDNLEVHKEALGFSGTNYIRGTVTVAFDLTGSAVTHSVVVLGSREHRRVRIEAFECL